MHTTTSILPIITPPTFPTNVTAPLNNHQPSMTEFISPVNTKTESAHYHSQQLSPPYRSHDYMPHVQPSLAIISTATAPTPPGTPIATLPLPTASSNRGLKRTRTAANSSLCVENLSLRRQRHRGENFAAALSDSFQLLHAMVMQIGTDFETQALWVHLDLFDLVALSATNQEYQQRCANEIAHRKAARLLPAYNNLATWFYKYMPQERVTCPATVSTRQRPSYHQDTTAFAATAATRKHALIVQRNKTSIAALITQQRTNTSINLSLGWHHDPGPLTAGDANYCQYRVARPGLVPILLYQPPLTVDPTPSSHPVRYYDEIAGTVSMAPPGNYLALIRDRTGIYQHMWAVICLRTGTLHRVYNQLNIRHLGGEKSGTAQKDFSLGSPAFLNSAQVTQRRDKATSNIDSSPHTLPPPPPLLVMQQNTISSTRPVYMEPAARCSLYGSRCKNAPFDAMADVQPQIISDIHSPHGTAQSVNWKPHPTALYRRTAHQVSCVKAVGQKAATGLSHYYRARSIPNTVEPIVGSRHTASISSSGLSVQAITTTQQPSHLLAKVHTGIATINTAAQVNSTDTGGSNTTPSLTAHQQHLSLCTFVTASVYCGPMLSDNKVPQYDPRHTAFNITMASACRHRPQINLTPAVCNSHCCSSARTIRRYQHQEPELLVSIVPTAEEQKQQHYITSSLLSPASLLAT